MSLEMAKEKCGGLRYVENRVKEGESSHNLLSTCKFFHLFVESLHNESADTSVEYMIHQQLQEYKITPISQNWMQMDMPLSAVPSDGSHASFAERLHWYLLLASDSLGIIVSMGKPDALYCSIKTT